MSFNQIESSRQLGEPITLYMFRYGDINSAVFCITDAEQPVEFIFEDPDYGPLTLEFSPETIDRGEISSSGSLDKSTLDVTISHGSPLAIFMATSPPSQIISLTIFEGHVGDGNFHVIWVGRVLGKSNGENSVELSCEPASTSLRRNGLRRPYSHQCPYAVYDPETCKAEKALGVSGVGMTINTINTINGAIVNFTGPLTALAGDAVAYSGGLFEWTAPDGRSEHRTIIRTADSGHTVILSAAPVTLSPGDYVECYLGCEKTPPICLAWHDNILNFGGQPRIPTSNPLGIRNNFI